MTMVEKVARIIDPGAWVPAAMKSKVPIWPARREDSIEKARAAIVALRTPSEGMVEAAGDSVNSGVFTSWDVISETAIKTMWTAAIDAALLDDNPSK